jgi:hypothetical protein
MFESDDLVLPTDEAEDEDDEVGCRRMQPLPQPTPAAPPTVVRHPRLTHPLLHACVVVMGKRRCGAQEGGGEEEEDAEEEEDDDAPVTEQLSRVDRWLTGCRQLPVVLPPLQGPLAGEVNALTRGSNLRHKVAAVGGPGPPEALDPAARPRCRCPSRAARAAALLRGLRPPLPPYPQGPAASPPLCPPQGDAAAAGHRCLLSPCQSGVLPVRQGAQLARRVQRRRAQAARTPRTPLQASLEAGTDASDLIRADQGASSRARPASAHATSASSAPSRASSRLAGRAQAATGGGAADAGVPPTPAAGASSSPASSDTSSSGHLIHNVSTQCRHAPEPGGSASRARVLLLPTWGGGVVVLWAQGWSRLSPPAPGSSRRPGGASQAHLSLLLTPGRLRAQVASMLAVRELGLGDAGRFSRAQQRQLSCQQPALPSRPLRVVGAAPRCCLPCTALPAPRRAPRTSSPACSGAHMRAAATARAEASWGLCCAAPLLPAGPLPGPA